VPDKANEVGAAGESLLTLVPAGRIVTADALLAQREVAQTVLDGGGDSPLVVKEDQPTLHAALAATFAPQADGTGLVGDACTVDQHASRIGYRRLTASTARTGYSDWPGRQQARRIERRTLHQRTGAVPRAEVADAVTSVHPRRAAPPQVLALWRGHWSIENRRHHIRDGAFAEDRATVRARHAPQVMAAFRNAAIGLIHALGATAITATCRLFAAQPLAAFRALGTQPDLE
jgi:predicted transposase YbfD/YdcC